MSKPRLLLTIDVEEDMPGWQITDPITVRNVGALPRLAEMCTELGVRPTYLCTYPVVTDPGSSIVLRSLAGGGGCEIGTHLHAWNTPPFHGVPGRDGDERAIPYYQFELAPEDFRAKLDVLHAAIKELTSEDPVSFRAGRFGIDAHTLAALAERGYQVDTSITPLAEHMADEGPDFRSAPRFPYRPSRHDAAREGDLDIVEVPVSIGLTRSWPTSLQRAFVRLPKGLRVRGLLSSDYLKIVDYAWLYPVRFGAELMARTADALAAAGSPMLNVFLHSSELIPAASGRIQTAADVENCFARLRGILEHCLGPLGAEPATLRDFARELRPRLGLTG